MADTKRSLATVLALLADNTTGDISAQDMRDAVLSLSPDYGDMYMTPENSTETTITDTTNFFVIGGTFIFKSGLDWDMNTNGQLRYTGAAARAVTVTASCTFTAASNNQTLEFALAKNGVVVPGTYVDKRVGTGTDVRSLAIVGLETVTTNDYVSILARNQTSTANCTIKHMNVCATGYIL